MVAINTKTATYTYTTSTFNSGRGMAVTFTRNGDADAAQVSGEKTSTLQWASKHANVDIRNDSSFPIVYQCWYIDDGYIEFTGTLAAGESKRIAEGKPTGIDMKGVFTGVNITTIYGVSL